MTEGSEDREATRADAPSATEPSLAERARTLLHLARDGVLSTHSRKAAGFPFGSLAPYGLDAEGRPTFLLSTLALHTRNLVANHRASLLVAEPQAGADPLSAARATLVGNVDRLAAEDTEVVRENYLERHPEASRWVDFGDFGFFRMDVVDLYFVAGFGTMGWVDVASYARASPDPLAGAA